MERLKTTVNVMRGARSRSLGGAGVGMAVIAFVALPVDAGSAHAPVTGWERAAEIYRFPVRGTSRARGAEGSGVLQLAASPFGVAVSADGHLVYDLEISIEGLLPPARLGAGAYVAWIATPDLQRLERLGEIGAAGTLRAQISSMNKFLFMVTAEPDPDVRERSGPILARGVSPSGLLQSFGQHELFNNMPHE